MKKADRIAGFIHDLSADSELPFEPSYVSYFTCFNKALYYEAHDVLEHLWLHETDENRLYYKSLIQIAGAFVHLQKQFLRPDHPKDGNRLRPAVRLFQLAVKNLEAYKPRHLSLDVEALCRMCEQLAAGIIGSDFTRNPWNPAAPPQLSLEP